MIINTKDSSDIREEMRGKMSENFRHTRMRNSTHYKSEDEHKEAYCEGYAHGYEDAMKEISGGGEQGSNGNTSEFRYGGR